MKVQFSLVRIYELKLKLIYLHKLKISSIQTGPMSCIVLVSILDIQSTKLLL